ncbi:sigma 54-interacting transcriptional regulator [Aquifex sp.]
MDFRIFDNFFDGILVINKERKIIYANEKAREILGEGVKEGGSCYGLFSICKNCPLELVEEEGKGVQVYDVITKNGKHVCLSMSPNAEGGKFLGVVEVFRDVSRVIHYMEEVKRQKEFVEVILNSIVEAVIVTDENGNILEHNSSAKKVLCSEVGEIKGKNIKEVIGLSIQELPSEGERVDLYVRTPCGKQKASVLVSRLTVGGGYVLSFYVVPELFITEKEEFKIITKSPKFIRVLEKIKSVAELDVNILITGETGTGKTLLARYIHLLSPRRENPFIKINCGAIPENLLEAELFGYNKGAFTGAVRNKPGKVELADGGTLFLDEIGELPLHLQVKLLHFIQEKEFERIGDLKPRKVDVRIVAATNKNLKKLVEEGRFREDLYYRLNVVNVEIPPLRERKEDIPHLVDYFLKKFTRKYGKRIEGITPGAMRILLSYDYPGNVRELENIIESCVVICEGSLITENDLPEDVKSCNIRNKEIGEKERILEALRKAKGNKSLAAKLLGIHRTTLWRKLKEYGIS